MSKDMDGCRRCGFSRLRRASGMVKRNHTMLKLVNRPIAIDIKQPMVIEVPSPKATTGAHDRKSIDDPSPVTGPGWNISQTKRYSSAMAVGEP